MKPRANESAGFRRMTDYKYSINLLNSAEGGKQMDYNSTTAVAASKPNPKSFYI